MRLRRHQRGVSMIEVTVALGVLALGMLGMARMQIIAVRSHHLARNMATASSIAHDTVEMIGLWNYRDPRLAPLQTVTTLTSQAVKDRMDLGREDAVASNLRPQFSEKGGDTNALNASALGVYDGVRADVDNDGKLDFLRYWSVFAHDPDGDGVESGKFVVVVVRWREPGFGMRQVVSTAFRVNEEMFAL